MAIKTKCLTPVAATPGLGMRVRAVFCCLYFGVVPSWFYELTPHHSMSYLTHLRLNLGMIFIWVRGQDEDEDWEFESRVNPSWSGIFGKLCRLQEGARTKRTKPPVLNKEEEA